MAISASLHLETGSQKFKMAAAKPEVPVSQLLYKIAKKFERLPPYFRGQGTQWPYPKGSILKPEVRKFKMAAAKPEVPISRLQYKIAKKFERLPICFQGRRTQWCYQ
jgi:hypothetical protein